MAAPQLMNWLDLSGHGAKLSLFQLPDKSVNLILSGVSEHSQEWNEVLKLGFEPSKSRRNLIRAGTDIQTSALRALFPKNKIVATPVDEVWLRIKGQAQDARNELQDTQELGWNYRGQTVFSGASGRFIRLDDGSVFNEKNGDEPALYLRAISATDIARSADGFVLRMLAGQVMDTGDLRHFAQIIYADDTLPAPTDPRLRTVQEAIEGSAQRHLSSNFRRADESAYLAAVQLLEHQPTFAFRTSNSVENQQYSTPLPMAIAVQRILGDTAGKKVFEPTIGNASLVMVLPDGTDITGVEIDPARAEQARMMREGLTVLDGDVLQMTSAVADDFDFVVANPPFGGLAAPVVIDQLRVTRIDHRIALAALKRRTVEGRAVFILAADRDSLFEKGKISGGSKTFFAWLSDHYEIEDAVELNGALYRKQGADYPVRMVTVGRRVSESEVVEAKASKKNRLGDTVPVIHTWEALWSHVNALVHRLNEKAPADRHAGVEQLEVDKLAAPRRNAVAVVPALAVANSGGGSLPDASGSAPSTSGEPEEKFENDYQAPYLPASQLNEPSAMIPRNLLEPVRKALASFEVVAASDVDSFVADKLQMDMGDVQLAFSAEQVDAIALAIQRCEEGRGFIEGDQTGLGKGRVLAGLARYAALQGQPVIFLTEKANLFSDFWRDLKDIGTADLFRPLVLNNGEAIRNMATNKIEIPAAKAGAIAKFMDDDAPLSMTEYNLLFATYSQFNRERAASKKATWLPAASMGAMLMLDESHNAAGDSNTSDNISVAVEKAASCIYSSATFAKNATNMKAYAKIFPQSVEVEKLAGTLQAGGEPLQEILSGMLAEEGVFIRREHDLSKLQFETVLTEETRERDERWADALSAALREMSYFSGDVTRVTTRMNKQIKKSLEKLPEAARKGNRMGVSYQSFGSRLYNILRQFSLMLKVDKVADLAVRALAEGRKPVIVLEQTFEAILKESMADDIKTIKIDPDTGEPVDDSTALVDGRVLPEITLRDMMHKIARKLEYIYVRDDYGNGHYEHVSASAETDEEREAIERTIEQIHESIDKLPTIPVTPIDSIRQKIEAAGYSCGEISGRSFETNPVPEQPGMLAISVRPDQRLRTIQEFNNGKVDAVILTRAGSTGLSLHASEKFADRRQREMIELQIANNVAERVQFFGRVNRKGQVNSPRITSVATPLPSEIRVLAMQNAKLRRLSANTQSNRNNQAEIREVPDILNKVGNQICRRYLEDNPDIAALLDIDPDEVDTSEDEAYFANKLTGRIALLPVAKQKAAYAEISRVYGETLKEMESKGINPFKTSVYDWKAQILDQRVFRPGLPTGSVFDQAVYIARAEWTEEITPFSSEQIKTMVEMGRRNLTQGDNRFALEQNRYATKVGQETVVKCDGMLANIDRCFDTVQQQSLRSLPQYWDREAALQADETNPIKNSEQRRLWLRRHLQSMTPGGTISFTGEDELSHAGMITSLFTPDNPLHAHLLGQYTIRVAIPGKERTKEFTLNQLMTDPAFSVLHTLGDDWENPFKAFDAAEPGAITFSRLVLTGNMFAAAQFASENGSGRAAIFTDAAGERHRAVVLPAVMTMEDALKRPVSLSKERVVAMLQRANVDGISVKIIANPKLDEKCCTLTVDRNRPGIVSISVNGNKLNGGLIFNNKEVLAVAGEFAGTRQIMSASLPLRRADELVEILVSRCSQGFYADAGQVQRLLPETVSPPAADENHAPARRPKFAA